MSSVRIDVRDVLRRADALGKADAQSIGEGARAAVNRVATAFDKTAERNALDGINLTPAYYRSKADLALATTPVKPEAVITVKGDLTVLGRFPGTTSFTSPGAIRRAGPVRGRRSAGVNAEIRRGNRLSEPQWFVMKLRNQQGLLGVFVRDDAIAPKNKRDGVAGKRHIYGPSPYQLFRRQVALGADGLSRDLETAAREEINAVLQEALK